MVNCVEGKVGQAIVGGVVLIRGMNRSLLRKRKKQSNMLEVL